MGRIARRDRVEPAGRLVKFDATDGVELYGLLFEPQRRSKRAAIFLHGTGGASIFDSRRTNPMAAQFIANGVAYFPFNNRGAHLMKRLRKRGAQKRTVNGGMTYERIRDCVPDIDGAIRELRRRGYREFTLIGHSTGANKIAVYDYYRHRNPVRNYVFVAGGDDVGLMYDQLGARRFRPTLARARTLRNSEELVPESISDVPMSWRSFYDMTNPDGDYNVFPYLEVMERVKMSKKPLFRHLRGIRKPSLVVYGDRDEYLFDDVARYIEILMDALGPKPNFEYVVIRGANHGFGKHEAALAQVILRWMGR